MENHPIVQGAEDIWGPTDVYGINDLTGDSEPLIMGQVLTGMNPSDPDKESISKMPIAWIKSYTGETGNKSKVFTSTMGAATDFESEGLRRLLVNAAYWGLNMENQIPERSNVDITEELVNLITAQRNFQASAKAIETTTTLTQTIINIRM